ncbi:hypothetical protein ACFCXR_15385 [Streptomyces noursei]
MASRQLVRPVHVSSVNGPYRFKTFAVGCQAVSGGQYLRSAAVV